MKIIKIIDCLADRFLGKFKGSVLVPHSFNQRETLINMMKERLNKLENENKSEENFKRLSKEQEIRFIKNLILRLESEK